MVLIFITILIFALYAGLIIFYRTGWLQMPTETEEIVELSTRISVIIPARNEEDNIYDCLQSVTSQTCPSHLYEVIVVDDYSTDKTGEIVRFFGDKNVSLISL